MLSLFGQSIGQLMFVLQILVFEVRRKITKIAQVRSDRIFISVEGSAAIIKIYGFETN